MDLAVFQLSNMIPTEQYSALVREKPWGRERVLFEMAGSRAGCAGPISGSTEKNSRVMLVRSANDPFLASHDLTRPVSFSSPLEPTRPDP